MSEYIEIKTEFSDDGHALFVTTNLTLADGPAEAYESLEAMETGSPLAQALSAVEGIAWLEINGRCLTLQRHPDAAWHHIVADLSAVLKDFFL